MKAFFYLVLFLSLEARAQKALLLDRGFFQPVQVVDSVGMKQVTMGFMPVYAEDAASVLSQLKWLMTHINKNTPELKGLLELNAGRSCWIVRVQHNGGRKKYTIVLSTKFGLFETYAVIASNEYSKRTLQRLAIFADYLRNNGALTVDTDF